MAKITIVTCDNCGQRCDESWVRIAELSQDWCVRCRRGMTHDLTTMPWHDWPKLVTKQAVREVLEEHDKAMEVLKDELRHVHKANNDRAKELRDLRRQAADAYASSNRPQEDLKDIATSAKREAD